MELRKEVRHIFDYITQGILSSEYVPELSVPDPHATDASNFCPSEFTYVWSHIATKKVNLLKNPYHMHKLLLVLRQLDTQAKN